MLPAEPRAVTRAAATDSGDASNASRGVVAMMGAESFMPDTPRAWIVKNPWGGLYVAESLSEARRVIV
jgi:hypothetical protein